MVNLSKLIKREIGANFVHSGGSKKEKMFNKRMMVYDDEYDENDDKEKKYKVFCGTFNMGNKECEGLETFLPKDGQRDGTEYDIIVIGLQESTYTTSNEVDVTSIKHLEQQIVNLLGTGYHKIKHTKRVQMQLYIFCKLALIDAISHVESCAENTGFLHIFPNKVSR